jgi:hypothetical protein
MLRRIVLGDAADASTLMHETAHYWMDRNFKRVHSGLAAPELERQWLGVERWLGIDPEATRITVAQSEKFARAYENFLYDGEITNERLRPAFERYRAFMQEIYEDLDAQYFDVPELGAEIISFFNANNDAITAEALNTAPERTEEVQAEADAGRAISAAINKSETAPAGGYGYDDTFNTGETAKSQLVRSMQKRASDAGMDGAAISEIEYRRRERGEKVVKASDALVENNPQLAWDIVAGKAPEQGGIMCQDIFMSLEAKYEADNDLDGLVALSKYAKAIGAEAGNRLQTLSRRPEYSAVGIIASLNEKVLSGAEKKAVEKEIPGLKSEIDKAALGWDESVDEAFFREMECK